jgi:hypothetical protein
MRLNAKKLIAKMLPTAGRELPEEDCAIYAIYNTVNERIYIGSSKTIRKRLVHHIGRLRIGKHSNELLQMDWNEHGPDAFVFGVLMRCHPFDLKYIEGELTRQVLGPKCYAWSYGGPRGGQFGPTAGHPAMPTLGRCW